MRFAFVAGMGKLIQDVQLSLRGLMRRPGFALVAVSTIALGIAAAGAIWSVVDAVLVRSLPFDRPDRLVFVWETFPARNVDRNVAGPANFIRWRERARSFTDLAAYIRFDTNLDGAGGDAERIAAGFTTGNLFTVLGAPPLLGRTLLASDSLPGAAEVVVLTESYWRRRFGADPAAVGRTLRLNGVTNTIVGVMPASVQIPPGAVLWAPMKVDETMRSARGRWMTVVARLRDGVSVAQAHDEMARIGEALAVEEKEMDAGWGVNVQPLHADLVRQVRPGLVLLLVAVAVLLLIACVNVANLLLAAGVVRERELAIRAALGAGRGRLLRQLLTESLVLASVAGIVGAFAGRSLLGAIQTLLPPEIAEVVNVSYDLRAVAAAALVALGSALVFGIVPAFQSARVGLTGALKEGGSVRGSGRSRSRLKQGLVVAEVCLSALLLVATGLLLRSFWKLGTLEPGFDADGVLAASLAPRGDAYEEPERVEAFYREAMTRLRALPGVTAAGGIAWTPLGRAGGAATSFRLMKDPPPLPGQAPVADVRVVTPGLFETLRIRLLAGRDFDDSDRPERPPVAIINASLARQLGGDAAAIGQRLKLSWRHENEIEIVGVVGDVRLTSLETPARATVYLPHGQDGNNFMTLMLRTDAAPSALVPDLRAAIAALDPSLPVGSAQPLAAVVSDSLGSRRFVLVLVAVFGGIALALAGIGLFGVMAYLVAQRTSELGVRLMLGARPADVLRLVVRDGMRLVALGLVLGLLAGVLASRALESQLFGVRPFDPLALAGVAAALALVALLALATPAWRAASIDPARAMRVE
jgi:putative ABC transport system permease protein